MKSILAVFFLTILFLLGASGVRSAYAAETVKKKAKTEERGITLVEKNSNSQKRIALVIGNSSYSNSPLKNPANDSKDIATKLRKLGFDVIERNNLKTKQIGGTLREFRSKLEPGAIALVFYAGHGLQIKGENYFPTVDADIDSEEDVHNQSLAMKQIMDVLDESKSRLNLVFLDACRNNPYARSFRSAERGLARVSAPSGTLISYATKPGSVAADGVGRNGLYTSKLIAQMDSNDQIEQALKRVVTEVKVASNGKQEPWMEGSIEGDFCFGGCDQGERLPLPVPTPTSLDTETEAWNITKETSDIEVIRDFLKEYPNGKYSGPARLKLKEYENKDKNSKSTSSNVDSYKQSPRSMSNLNLYFKSAPSNWGGSDGLNSQWNCLIQISLDGSQVYSETYRFQKDEGIYNIGSYPLSGGYHKISAALSCNSSLRSISDKVDKDIQVNGSTDVKIVDDISCHLTCGHKLRIE